MRRFGRAPNGATRGEAGGVRGAAGVLAILFMPVMLAALAASVGLGQALVVRYRISQAADLAALAAIQCLDLDRMSHGKLVLLAADAVAVAEEYASRNLATVGFVPDEVDIEVDCHNAGEGIRRDAVTGKVHEYTTVCVTVRCQVPIALGPFRIVQSFAAHADASAVPR